jgi:hypothetical protein
MQKPYRRWILIMFVSYVVPRFYFLFLRCSFECTVVSYEKDLCISWIKICVNRCLIRHAMQNGSSIGCRRKRVHVPPFSLSTELSHGSGTLHHRTPTRPLPDHLQHVPGADAQMAVVSMPGPTAAGATGASLLASCGRGCGAVLLI